MVCQVYSCRYLGALFAPFCANFRHYFAIDLLILNGLASKIYPRGVFEKNNYLFFARAGDLRVG
jgi:hypothetical protein